MYNDERQSTRSPTLSRTGSYTDGPAPRSNGRAYQSRSSITEDIVREDNEYEEALDEVDASSTNVRPPQRSEDQYIAALRYRFPNRPKNDYSYTKPSGPLGMFCSIDLPSITSYKQKFQLHQHHLYRLPHSQQLQRQQQPQEQHREVDPINQLQDQLSVVLMHQILR